MVALSGMRGRLLAASVMAALVVGAYSTALSVAQTAAQTAAQTTVNSAAPAQQTIAEKIAASKDLLDINTATAAELNALPGMGDAYARRVIAGRPYTAKNQLTTRGILPAAEYERIKALIIAHRVKP
jgi:DNA uptake protein ComE-like DNA-binding protein